MVQTVIEELRTRLERPTARGLANAVSRAVNAGSVSAGEKLPPIRQVARELSLSPTTVSAAWALLVRAGTIHTDGRRGSVIADQELVGPSRYRRALQRNARFEIDLSTGVPDPALLPDLTSALHRLHAAVNPETYLDDPIVAELHDHLRADWPFPTEAMTVVDGALDALALITSCFVRFGDRVAVEHPCFPPTLDLLESAGAELVPVDLDDDGPLPGSLSAAVREGARVFFLQPRAQNPTGASLSADRTEELAAVLAGTDVLVVENDSAGMVASSPATSLGTRLPRRTLHVRGFSKSHGPDLRLAAVGGPATLVERIVERRRLGQGWTSRLLQRLLLDMLTDSTCVAQVERARAEYARRREALAGELAGLGVRVGGRDGLNIWLPVDDEAAAVVGLVSRGIGVAPGAPFAVRRDPEPHLRVTAGLLEDGHAAIATALGQAARPHPAHSRMIR